MKIDEISKAQIIPTYLAENRLAKQRIERLVKSCSQFVRGVVRKTFYRIENKVRC